MHFKTGKLAPHPEETHPRVKLADHLTGMAAAPTVVDYASKVASWPVYLNDQLGDCTCAGVGHCIQAWTAYAGAEAKLTNAQVLGLYERFGYNPKTGKGDNGAVEQDVLASLVKNPVAGHGVVAFAQVNHKSAAEMKLALNLFGSLYVGIGCPASMQQQFAAGEVIDYVPGSPVEGGHCVVIQKWDADYLYIVTWGALVKMTWAFWEAYGDEAWAIVTKDFIEKNGKSPSGLSLQTLLDEFSALGMAAYSSKPGFFQSILNWLRRNLATG